MRLPEVRGWHALAGLVCKASLLCLCQILCPCWVRFGLGVVLGVDRIRVVSESNSCTLGLPYNEGSTTRVTHDDLIATGAQGEPAACAGA